MVGGGVIINETHVMNTVRSLRLEFYNEEIPPSPSLFLQRGSFEFVLPSMHGVTCVDFGIITLVRGGEGLYHKVRNPLTELIVMRRDEASLLAVKGVSDVKCCATYIEMV